MNFSFIFTEKLPLGFRYEALSHSRDTHQLPIPPDCKGEKNYQKILQEIIKFLGPELPPLFTMKEDIPMIKSFFKQFCALTDEDYNHYRVYPLHQLFFDIKQEAVKININNMTGFPSIYIAEAHLKRDRYAFVGNIACNVSYSVLSITVLLLQSRLIIKLYFHFCSTTRKPIASNIARYHPYINGHLLLLIVYVWT